MRDVQMIPYHGEGIAVETTGGIQAGLSGRYARALFELALDGKALETVSESMRKVGQALTASVDLRDLIANPLLHRADAGKAMTALSKAIKADKLTANFLGVIAENKRIAALTAMVGA